MRASAPAVRNGAALLLLAAALGLTGLLLAAATLREGPALGSCPACHAGP